MLTTSTRMTVLFIGIILYSLHIAQVTADYENACASSDYRPGLINACRAHLAKSLYDLCEQDIGKRVKREIFYETDKANSFLRTKQLGEKSLTGIVCECCVHRCTTAELLEYCELQKRRKRSLLSGTHRRKSKVMSPALMMSPALSLERLYRESKNLPLFNRRPSFTDNPLRSKKNNDNSGGK